MDEQQLPQPWWGVYNNKRNQNKSSAAAEGFLGIAELDLEMKLRFMGKEEWTQEVRTQRMAEI